MYAQNFEQLLKHIFPSFWGGGEFNSVGLDHSGSQPFDLSLLTEFSLPSMSLLLSEAPLTSSARHSAP